MNVEPCAAVIRTLIQSDRTCVPPVTAERSPPDSRMTGADSPVIAASLTEATPSTTSPSDGMMSPASTSTRSPTLRLVPGTVVKSLLPALPSSLACVSVRVRRRDSACAFPRPSATASAKLANSTVNQSHSTIWNEKPILAPPVATSFSKRTVVSSETTATTNMTGLRARLLGLSLRNASPMAGMRMRASSMPVLTTLADWDLLIGNSRKAGPEILQQRRSSALLRG